MGDVRVRRGTQALALPIYLKNHGVTRMNTKRGADDGDQLRGTSERVRIPTRPHAETKRIHAGSHESRSSQLEGEWNQ